MNNKKITNLLVVAAAVVLSLGASSALAQTSPNLLVPTASWDCGMPEGIQNPEAGQLVFEIDVPLERVVEVGKTQYGMRRVAVGLEGSVKGPRLSGAVTPGALDFELTLANGTIEIEQALVLRAPDGSYIYARNAGTGPNSQDVRIVMDFEAPNASEHAWLNSGKFVARRELNAAAKTMHMRVYDVTNVPVGAGTGSLSITKPADVAAQPWAYRSKEASEQQGQMLITENVTLAPSQRVGASKLDLERRRRRHDVRRVESRQLVGGRRIGRQSRDHATERVRLFYLLRAKDASEHLGEQGDVRRPAGFHNRINGSRFKS